MTDLISRADAIEAVGKWMQKEYGYLDLNRAERLIDALSALPSAETHEIRTETHGVCLISKDDAMGAVQDHFNANGFKGYDDGQKMMDRIKALPSAEAEQTVIRSRTLMPTKDFKEWAKRVRETNPNVIVIPCDAEVVSDEAVSREEYEETDGVIKIKRQSAKDVGKIKSIVVCSPNYTRYFYNDSMPTQYKGGDEE